MTLFDLNSHSSNSDSSNSNEDGDGGVKRGGGDVIVASTIIPCGISPD